MAEELGREHYIIDIDNQKLQESCLRAVNQINNIGNAAENEGLRIDRAFQKVGMAVGAYFGVQQLQSFAQSVLKVRSEIESLEISFKTLIGDENKAAKLFKEIREYAVETPMQMNDLAQGAQMMLGFGIETEKVMGYLKELGDISMGNAQSFNSLTLAFSQATAAGKLMGQDYLQLINAGFNPLKEISRTTGKSMSELKDEMSKGKITAEMLADALKSATSEGGKFNGMLKSQSKSVNGAISNLQGAWNDMLNDIGTQTQGVFVDTVLYATEAIKNYEKFASVLESIIATYGAYKATLIAVQAIQMSKTVIENIRLVMMFRKELGLLTAAQQAFNIAAMENPYVLLAAAIAAVTGALVYYYSTMDKTSTSQKELNKSMDETAKRADDEKKHLDDLLAILNDTTKSEGERNAALVELQNLQGAYIGQVGKVFQKYKTYKDYVDDATNSQRALNEELERTNALNNIKAYEYDKNILKNLMEYRRLKAQINSTVDGNAKLRLQQQIAPIWGALPEEVKKAAAAGESLESIYESYRKKAGIDAQSIRDSRNNTWNAKWLGNDVNKDALKKELNIQRAYLKRANSKDYVIVYGVPMAVKDIENRIAAGEAMLEASKNKNNTTTPPKADSGTADKAAKALYDADAYKREQEKLAQQQKRDAEDMAMEVAQAEIDANRKGADKVIAQLLLDQQRERIASEREQEDYLQKKKNDARSSYENDPKNAKYSIFDDSTINLTEEEKSLFEQKWAALLRIQLEAQKKLQTDEQKAMNDYLMQYGNYQERLHAIQKHFAYLKENANTEGEKLIFGKQEEEQIERLNLQFGLATDQFADLFANASRNSVYEIQKIIDKYKLLVSFLKGDDGVSRDDVLKFFSEEQLQKFDQGKITIKDVTDRLEKLDGIVADKSPWKAFQKAVADAIDKLNKGNLAGGIQGICTAIKEFMPAVKEFANSLDNLFGGSNGDSIEDYAKGLEGLMATGEAFASFAARDYVGGAMSLASGLSTIKDAIAGVVDRKHERRIKALQDYIDNLEKSYGDLEKAVSKTYSKAKQTNIEAEISNRQEQINAIQKQIQEERDKKKTDNGRISEWEDRIKGLRDEISDLREEAKDAIFGSDIQSAIESFADAWTSAWESGTSTVRTARQQVREMMKAMVKESIKSATESSKAMENIRAKLAEFWADEYLSDTEQKIVEGMAEKLDRDLTAKYGWADRLWKEDYTQSGTTGGFATASQDSVDELNGRFAAVQMNTNSLVESVAAIQMQSAQQSESLASIRQNMEQTMNISREGINHLANIEKYTSNLVQMNERLDQIERNTRAL
ncbi:MAG: tape measure protein [Bacteroidaceae bacterium]|nr:tape measure protein [Bacteroidaceae bacterium]